MARYEGPVRFRYKGDPELARQYIQFGRVILGQVDEEVQRTGLPELIRNVRMQDGVTMSVRVGRDRERTIEIFKEEPPPEPEEPLEGFGFVTIPTADEAPDGWGEPFFDGEGVPINPPLGTIGGQFPQTWIDYDPENGNPWVPYRYPDYQAIWPNGILYGNKAWATRLRDESFVLSYGGPSARYRTYGNSFSNPEIYFRGNLLSTAPFAAIAGACVFDGFLVVAGFDGGLQWKFRPFRAGGYSNDDPYDAETNPIGWRDCGGSGASNPSVEQITVTHTMSFSRNGGTALLCNRIGSPFAAWGIVQNRWTLSEFEGVVSVVHTVDGQTNIDNNSGSVRTGIYVWSCSWVVDEFGQQSFTRQSDATLQASDTLAVLFREFDPSDNIVQFLVSLPAGSETEFQHRVGTADFPFNEFDITDTIQSTLSFPGNVIAGAHTIGYRVGSRSLNFQERRFKEEFGEEQVEIIQNETTNNDGYSILFDGNLSLNCWLIYEYLDGNQESRFLVLLPDGTRHEMLQVLPGVPFGIFEDFPAGNRFYGLVTGFVPPGGWCSCSSTPCQDIRGDTDTIPLDTLPGDVQDYYGNVIAGNNFELRDLEQDSFQYGFAAFHDGVGNTIITAYVDYYRGSIDTRYFASYDFITDGNLPLLTQVQGTNPRHKGTGVI